MQLSEQELKDLLIRFDGCLLPQQPSFAKRFFLKFFTQQTINTIHADISIDITQSLAIYKSYYQREGSSFNSYLYYNLIKTMQKEEFALFRYRYINDAWYQFDNPPFFISVKINDPDIEQVDFFIENSAHLSWAEFVRIFSKGVSTCRQTKQPGSPEKTQGWYGVSHQMTSMPFLFTSYNPSQKRSDLFAHGPWFVFSQRQTLSDDTIQLNLSCTLSHASTLPSNLDCFIGAFKKDLCEVPEHQKITHYFNRSK